MVIRTRSQPRLSRPIVRSGGRDGPVNGDGAWRRSERTAEKAVLYGHTGLKLTYHPNTNSVMAEASPAPSEVGSCPRGDLNPHAR
jgi:hypothetical protein